MPVTESDVRSIIRANRGGRIEEVIGPTKLGKCAVWEVWVFVADLNQYYTRYIVYDSGQEPKYFSEFYQFCSYADDAINEHHIRKMTFYVAAATFVMVLLTMLYLSVVRQDAQILTALLGVMASGAAFFFGRWINVKGAGPRQ